MKTQITVNFGANSGLVIFEVTNGYEIKEQLKEKGFMYQELATPSKWIKKVEKQDAPALKAYFESLGFEVEKGLKIYD